MSLLARRNQPLRAARAAPQAQRSPSAHVLMGLLALAMASASAGCGVREYLHSPQSVDMSHDFGPTTYLGGATKPLRDAGMSGNQGDASTPAEPDAQAVEPVRDAAVDGAQPPAPEPTTITLGGTPLRKSDVIAFLHFGHSNMAGRATEPADERPYFFTQTDPRAWMYHVGKMPELAKEPDTAGDMKSFDGMRAGPGTALLKLALERAPDKHFVSLGFGQSGATCMNFLPGGPYYDSATQAALAIQDRVTIAAIILMLGISENNAPAATNAHFAQCVSQLVSALRQALGQPELPVLLSDYERGATGVYAPDGEFGRTMIAQIAMVPELVSSCAIIPSDGIDMQDDHHFNLTGYKVWSRRALDLMQEHGWFPPR